jgi:hypothetical protein
MHTRQSDRSAARRPLARVVASIVAGALLCLFATAVSAQTATPTTPTTQTAQTTTIIIPGYCYNAPVTMTTDQSGNAVYTCTVTGQRIYPYAAGYAGYAGYPGYAGYAGYAGYGYGYGAYGYGAGWIPPGTYNGITCNGLYGCPLGVSPYYGGTYVNGNVICGLYVCGAVQPIKQ